MIKKIATTVLLSAAFFAFAQDVENRIEYPQEFELAGKSFKLTKSDISSQEIVVQEYVAKDESTAKSGSKHKAQSKITITRYPKVMEKEIIEHQMAELQEHNKAKNMEASEVGDHLYMVSYDAPNASGKTEKQEIYFKIVSAPDGDVSSAYKFVQTGAAQDEEFRTQFRKFAEVFPNQ
ncbi:hypothetical protein [Chryseobacterium sp. MFBS3-17]|uniref:hypothetical protein n=1 Tax=Chryseobacterium sp. MFBS3-17 TaxID=2886689 RepID=UPI001D0E989F|nr:hypothetical protein [Chryseobacterium sp. MFBS3-17]MCC2590977.1 hypothetical protein [Chryseobacterium sp. MFBS3-17]